MKTDPYAHRETAKYVVARDGHGYYWADDYNECLNWLQSHVPYSWHHAMTFEGWEIIYRKEIKTVS